MVGIRKFIKKYFVESVLVGVLVILCLASYIFARSLDMASKDKENYTYVSSEILNDNVIATIKQENKKNEASKVQRPYQDKNVKIVKNYYDYENSENQENSIIYYENTYIQNQGIDYSAGKTFEILSVADGEVISVTNDDIVGTTIKIKHDNDLISVYQSVEDVTINEKDKVTRGEVIAKSGTNAMGSDLGDHLHFELYVNGKSVNPENYFNKVN